MDKNLKKRLDQFEKRLENLELKLLEAQKSAADKRNMALLAAGLIGSTTAHLTEHVAKELAKQSIRSKRKKRRKS